MCRCSKRKVPVLGKSSTNGEPVFGEKGLAKIKVSDPTMVLVGDYTGIVYHFAPGRTSLFVDRRDLVYLLGDGVEEA